MLLLFAQFAVLAVYSILLVAGMLVERRRPESALLRSRGASSGHLALLALGEAVVLTVPAVAVAPFAAAALVPMVALAGPLANAHVIGAIPIDGSLVAVAPDRIVGDLDALVVGVGAVELLQVLEPLGHLHRHGPVLVLPAVVGLLRHLQGDVLGEVLRHL